MPPEAVPAGGLPWILAVPAFVFVVGAAVGAVKWIALRAEKNTTDAEARVKAAHDAKEALRVEKDGVIEAAERRADELEREFREHLDRDLDLLMAAKRGSPVSTKGPRDGTLAEKQDLYRRESQVLSPAVLAAARRLMEQETP